MKVSYTTLDGATSTAYLDQQLTSHPSVWLGTDKYTDGEVFVKSLGTDGWTEVKGERI